MGFRPDPAGSLPRRRGGCFVGGRKMPRAFRGKHCLPLFSTSRRMRRILRGKSRSSFTLVSGVWRMPRQSAGIWLGIRLCFQRGGGAAARPGGRPRLAFDQRLVQLPGQPLVADLACLTLEKGQQVAAQRAPSFQRHARNARQLGVVVGQPAASVPHCHQDQHVGADLLGGELQRIADEIGDVELHERPLAHAWPLLTRKLMEPAAGQYVMTRPCKREVCR